MKFSLAAGLVALLAAAGLSTVHAQATVNYTDPRTGISGGYFQDATTGFGILYAVPEDMTKYPDELILQITGVRSDESNGGGWAGLSLGGSMTRSLLVLAHVDENTGTKDAEVKVALRITNDYQAQPKVYSDPKTVVTKLAQYINATHYQITVRCQGCTSWNSTELEVSDKIDLTSESFFGGFAMSSGNGNVTETKLRFHNLGQGNFGVTFAAIKEFGGSKYGKYLELGKKVPPPTQTPKTGPTIAVMPPAGTPTGKGKTAPNPSGKGKVAPTPGKAAPSPAGNKMSPTASPKPNSLKNGKKSGCEAKRLRRRARRAMSKQ